MAKRKICQAMAVVLALGMCTTGLTGCGNEKRADGKTEIEVVSYKPEAVKAFEKIEKQFNETHDDIHLTISSPNEAMTILKTRFIREDYPDIIAIGGDINYSNFLDADLFEDISDLDVVDTVKEAYLDMDKELEFIPKDGTYALPYAANAAGVLYNKDMFDKAGVTEVPTSLEGIAEVADDLVNKGGAGEALSMGIYGWFFEEFMCKQGLPYVDNGNGREAAATKVAFDENGGALNILNEWKKLYDAGYAPNVGRGGDSGLADFSSGKAAMTLGSTASLKQILQDVNGSLQMMIKVVYPSVVLLSGCLTTRMMQRKQLHGNL